VTRGGETFHISCTPRNRPTEVTVTTAELGSVIDDRGLLTSPRREIDRPQLQHHLREALRLRHVDLEDENVPFVRLSGRWLEAFGFKEGAKFAAVGVEGGLLVLTVYEAAAGGRTSPRDASRAIGARDDVPLA